MTINLYEYYAQHFDKITKPEQTETLRRIMQCTPYYFPEPLDFRQELSIRPEQLNIPSPNTWIQTDVYFPEGPKTLIWVLSTSIRDVTILSTVGNSISAYATGTYTRDEYGELTLTLYDMESVPYNSGPYSIMLNMLLGYINRIGPRVITHSNLSRQVRRAAERSLGYPLKATTEIVIKQHPRPHQNHVTGEGPKKCWHEVKGHPRVYHRNTPDEFTVWIKPHDRGDPKLGLKRTKYRVETESCTPSPDVI